MNYLFMKEIAEEIYKKGQEDDSFNPSEMLELVSVKEGGVIGSIVLIEYEKLVKKGKEEVDVK